MPGSAPDFNRLLLEISQWPWRL